MICLNGDATEMCRLLCLHQNVFNGDDVKGKVTFLVEDVNANGFVSSICARALFMGRSFLQSGIDIWLGMWSLGKPGVVKFPPPPTELSFLIPQCDAVGVFWPRSRANANWGVIFRTSVIRACILWSDS